MCEIRGKHTRFAALAQCEARAMNPTFFELTPELQGSIVRTLDGTCIAPILHKPTGAALCGFEPDWQAALSWLDGAKLIYAEPKGGA